MTASAKNHEADAENEKTSPHDTAPSVEKRHHDTLESDDASSSSSPSVVVQATPKKTWRSYVWDTLDKSPEERHFLFKLDAVILTFASLGYFIKNLDQVSLLGPHNLGLFRAKIHTRG